MQYNKDQRIVMTLDAGGTNFVFSAVQAEKEIIKPIYFPAHGDSLEITLNTIIKGFEEIQNRLKEKPIAISFCFPGPTEYERGIIGDLENLPCFRGGVALGPMLEEKFKMPVFINNDGDIFAFGEAIAGFLPEINNKLKIKAGNRRYENLLGVTFGTGFGGGIVSRGNLFLGDNSAQAEINRMRNKIYNNSSAEESVSIRGVKRVYAENTGIDIEKSPSPKTIFEIAIGKKKGNKKAAIKAFKELAIVAGDTLANAITLIDGLIVIGGGLSGAYPVFLQTLVDEMNNSFQTMTKTSLNRLEVKVFNLENKYELDEFLKDHSREITVPFSNKKIKYDPFKRIGVGVTHLGTTKAVSIGAYAFALSQLDK